MKRTYLVIISTLVAACMTVALCGCATTYTPTTESPAVEGSSLVKAGTLTVGVDASSAPLAANHNGKITGIDVDVAAAIADELGLQLSIVDIGTKGDKAITDKQVDVVMGLDKADTSVTCWMSNVYVDTCIALFAKTTENAVPESGSTPIIAAQTSSLSAYQVSSQFGEGSLKTTADLKTAFSNLESGIVRYVACDAVVGSYLISSSALPAHIVACMEKPSGYCVGVATNNGTLKSKIAAAIANLSDSGVIEVIETKWLGEPLDLASVPQTAGAKTATTSSATSSSTSSATGSAGANAAQLPIGN